MAAKLTLDYIKSKVTNPKVSLSNLTYVKGKGRIDVTCEDHGTYNSAVYEFLKSPLNCKRCSQAASGAAKRTPFSEVVARASELHQSKYTYSHVDYTGKFAMVHYTCPEHGQIEQVLSKHLRGQGCSTCGKIKSSLNCRQTWEEITARCKEVHGDRYEYIKAEWPVAGKSAQLTIKCPVHGEFMQDMQVHVVQKSGCPACKGVNASKRLRMSFADIKAKGEKAHQGKYTYKSTGVNPHGRSTVTAVCGKHGEFTHLVNDHIRGVGCPSCSNRISKQNMQISEFLTSLGVEHEMEYTFPGTRKAFDIAIHSKKIVLEYNSTYWHSSEYIPSGQHKLKSDLASTRGYRCIHIFGNVWDERRPQMESLIRNALGLNPVKIHARKCEVVDVSRPEAIDFLNANHIQGYGTAIDCLGLRFNGELVALMGFTFNTSNRTARKFEENAELARYATSHQVVGGFTKLLKAWLKANPAVKSVVSFSDNSVFAGHTYAKAGFRHDATLAPDYKYREYGNKDTLFHKSRYQKSHLRSRFGEAACLGKTEKEITEEQGIFRVYDCGKTRWLLEV